MNEGRNLVPKRRFKEFEYADPWEQRKLGQLGKCQSGIGFSEAEQGGTKGVPFYKVSDMNNPGNENVMQTANNYVSIEQNKIRRWNPITEVPAIIFAKVGAAIMLNRKRLVFHPFLIDNNTMAYIFDKTWDIDFGKTLFDTIDLSSLAQTGALPSYNAPEVEDVEIKIPSLPEQKQIGTFFHNLDNLITLHQRKLDKVKAFKESCLVEMFPAEGERKPKRRFPGFTDAWELRKLGDLYTERNERGDNSLKILSVSIHHGVSNNELDSDELGKNVRRSKDKSLYKHVYPGDLIFNMMRAWQGGIGVTKSEGMVSPAYITAVPSDELYPIFMDYSLRREATIFQMNNLSYGVTDFRKRLYWDSFVRVTCSIPSVPEQECIAHCLQQFDNLITLHQRKLDKLKAFKEACLTEMFV